MNKYTEHCAWFDYRKWGQSETRHFQFSTMKSIIFYKLDKEIFTNRKEYFFTILDNRFELINDQLIDLLQEKYQKKFEPIYILSAEPGKYHRKSNYIIINRRLKKLRQRFKNKKSILLQHAGDLNKEFSESKFVKKVIDSLSKKQERIFVISFSSFGLNLSNNKIINIGAKKELVEKYDNKIEQIKLFRKLKLPISETKIYKNAENLRKAKIDYPSFVSPAFTSGGTENAIIFSKKHLSIFFSKLRKINKGKEFLVAKYIENIFSSPNSVGIVCGKNDTRILCLTDQIVRGVKHTGNIYPTSADDKNKAEMITVTKKIGDYLSSLGFRGMYGCDFIIDSKNKLYIVELNPRRQSCYLMLQLIAKNINLLEVELKLALGEQIPEFGYDNIQHQYVWLHSKLKQYRKYQIFIKEFKLNNEKKPFKQVGEKFICSCFPAEYILNDCNFFGYYIASGKSYEKVLENSKKDIEDILLRSLKDV